MDRWIAGFLQVAALVVCIVVGDAGEDAAVLLVPAAGASLAAMHLWARAARESALGPRKPAPAVEDPMSRVEDAIAAMQADIARLREDQGFFHELYAGDAPRAEALPPRGER